MCKKDKDCEAGQRCSGGTCTSTAVDELADTEPQPKTEPENAEGQGSDSDYAADPPADDPEARAASFKATNEAALAAATAGLYGRYKPYETPDKAIECEGLLGTAVDAVPAAAAEMLNNSCARGDMVRPSECPAVAALVGADQALADAKCPARPRYPVLRDQ